MIQLQNVSFGYTPEKIVLNNLSIHFSEGQIWGILGHNGAGKTTLFRLILDLLKPNSGSIVRKESSIDYLPEVNGIYDKLTSFENLKFRAEIKRQFKNSSEECDNMLKKLHLMDKRNEKAAFLSSGMRKRVGLGCALIGNSPIVLLDEPTNGLDPVSLELILAMITEEKENNKLVLINSHDLPSIQNICTHACIIQKGKIVFQGEIHERSVKEIYFGTLDEEVD